MAQSAVAVIGDVAPPLVGRTAGRYALAAAYLLSFCAGLIEFGIPGSASSLLQPLLMASCVAMWVVDDACRRGQPLSHATQLITFATWPVASLVYLVRSRGVRGLGWWLLNAVGMYAATIAGVLMVY